MDLKIVTIKLNNLFFWGAGRAAALALSSKFSSVALCANATYMVTRIAHLYDVELQAGAVVGLVGGLSTAVGTAISSYSFESSSRSCSDWLNLCYW